MKRLLGRGLLATLVASIATTVGAALAQSLGVDFWLPGAPEPIPVAGFGVMTGIWCVVGLVVASLVRRFATRPDRRWVQVAVALTVVSLVPPVMTGAGAATVATLMALHLVAAAVVIPAVARALAPAAGVNPRRPGGSPRVADGSPAPTVEA
ncbi:hypothetical protein GCM10009623_15750 [Nocardioides aestuarii]|uniref:DUF6069 family protein n=1 Tax=Nocardioides aestuarii TaxID=252231 RepID=A0ABW4TK86_9ACTN